MVYKYVDDNKIEFCEICKVNNVGYFVEVEETQVCYECSKIIEERIKKIDKIK